MSESVKMGPMLGLSLGGKFKSQVRTLDNRRCILMDVFRVLARMRGLTNVAENKNMQDPPP